MRITLLVLLFLAFVETSQAGNPEKIRTADVHSFDPGLIFKENKGQWYDRARYKLETHGAVMYLEQTSIYYILYNTEQASHIHPSDKPVTINAHAYRVEFIGANAPSSVEQNGKTKNYYNYFLGNDKTRWAADVHGYTDVLYKNIYPGIDVRYYIKDGLVKYDFIVQPGADASQIRLRYNGVDALTLKDGHLFVQTSVGRVVEMEPVSFQSNKKQLRCRYKLERNDLTFEFPFGYNKKETLTIDPTMIFSTYTGSQADNFGYTCTYDTAGNMYLGGYVNAINFGTGLPSETYPTTAGAFDITWNGGTGAQGGTGNGIGYSCDMGISKISSDGTQMIYSTYLGGSDNETPHSLFVNSSDQLVVYGRTYSDNFPVQNAFQSTMGGAVGTSDITITVFNTTATALVGSTYFGGSGDDGMNFSANEFIGGNLKRNYGDDARGEVICDAANNIYVASCTLSGDFPVSGDGFQIALAGAQDGCIFKLSPDASSLVYSTFIGGTFDDACYSMDLQADGSLYATGGTMSINFPVAGSGVNPTFLGGNMDGFVIHLSAGGTAITGGTFLGTNGDDQSFGIKLDLGNNVYVIGQTNGNYPVIIPPGDTSIYSNPNSGQFITKFNPTLTNIIYSTVFGNGLGQSNISPTAFLIDTCENIYICGWGGVLVGDANTWVNVYNLSENPMLNMPLTSNAFQSTTDGKDFYLMVLDKNAQSLLYGTYFGGNNPGGVGEHVDGGTSRFDENGIVYEAICAGCGGNSLTPTTPGVWSPTNQSGTNQTGNCNELGFKMDMGLYKVEAEAIADPAATGCAPLTVDFINNSVNASSYFWSFGTGVAGDTSISFEPTFTYTDTGTYPVMLIAYSPDACVPLDTAFTSVIVYDTRANAAFVDSIFDMCDSMIVDFQVNDNGPNAQFQWYVGDSLFSTDSVPSIVLYELGNYEITLVVTDTTACDPIDSFFTNILFDSRVETAMNDDTIEGCSPVTVQRTQHPINATTWLWTFSEGGTSSDTSISRTYTNPGTYTITYVASNAGKCNLHDTSIITVIVYPQPVIAAFTISQPSSDPQEYFFTNGSTGATTFLWNFGDGSTSNDVSPTHTFDVGSYDVCLTATNGGPCPATTCQRVDVVYKPVIDVPNAFSPTGDGNNDILYVRGVGVKTVLFRVFNRWGEKVFETNDLNIGWDGIYKDVPQEMDVYAWTLNALLDGDISVERKGNVTLVR